MQKNLLIIDNDRKSNERISLFLEPDGFKVSVAESGEEALEKWRWYKADIVLLDVSLPGMDGWEFCRRIRKISAVPIIIISAKSGTFEKVLGFEMGADDYVTKPYDIMEIKARVKALLRRIEGKNDPCGKEISYDGLTVSLAHYEIIINGVTYKAPPREIELLYELASNPNRVYTRDELLDILWGVDYFGDGRTVDVHIKRLRKKINGASDKWRLTTVWGIGYKFEVKND